MSDRDEQYVQDLARYLDERLTGFIQGRSTPVLQSVILTALNIADELFRERDRLREQLATVATRARRLHSLLGEDDLPAGSPAGPGEEG